MGSRALLAGNRLALLGALLYLSEWIAIVFLPERPTDKLGEDAASIVAAYAGEATKVALLTGWLSFVLLGRVVFAVALRHALRTSPSALPWADIAVGAMAISVAIEIVQLGLAVPAGWLAEAGADASAIVALDAAASVLFTLIVVVVGASVLASSIAMLTSGLFAHWLCWLGLVTGAAVIAGGVIATGGLGADGTLNDLAEGPAVGPPVLAFWIWMLATSIVLFRARPRGAEAPAG